MRSGSAPSPPRYEVIGIEGVPEVKPGDDIARFIAEAAGRQSTPLAGGDLLVVGQKIVSKAEGRLVRLADVTPSPVAEAMAVGLGRDPRLVEVILRVPTRASTSRTSSAIASRSSPRIPTARRGRCATGSGPSPAPTSA